MVYLYDEALVAKLKKWTEKTDVLVLGPEETRRTFELYADRSGDKPLKLPIVALRRKPGFTILNPNKTVLTYGGKKMISDDEAKALGKTVQLNGIPIMIEYQLDIYTKYLKDADIYVREFIFNIINHPTGEVIIPYNGFDLTHKFNIRLSDAVEDNSDIPERLFEGEFTRLSLSINIDDAYLWDTPIRGGAEIVNKDLHIYKQEQSADVVIEELK